MPFMGVAPLDPVIHTKKINARIFYT